MKISNIDTKGIENLPSKDVIKILSAIESRFGKFTKIFINNSISYGDKKFELMQNIEFTLQAFIGKEQSRFVGKLSRSKDFGSSNGVVFKETDESGFDFELRFQKKFNHIQ